jgi:hypothetical protein
MQTRPARQIGPPVVVRFATAGIDAIHPERMMRSSERCTTLAVMTVTAETRRPSASSSRSCFPRATPSGVRASDSQRLCWWTYDRRAEQASGRVECVARLRHSSQLLAPGRVTASCVDRVTLAWLLIGQADVRPTVVAHAYGRCNKRCEGAQLDSAARCPKLSRIRRPARGRVRSGPSAVPRVGGLRRRDGIDRIGGNAGRGRRVARHIRSTRARVPGASPHHARL